MKRLFQPITDSLKPLAFKDGWRILQTHDDWLVQEAPASPWYWWLSSMAFIHGLAGAGYSPGSFFTTVRNERGILVVEHKTFVRLAKRLLAQEFRGQSVIKRWIKAWRLVNRRYQQFVSKIREKGLSGYTGKELATLFKKFCQIYYEVETLPICNEFFIPYTDSIFSKEMAKRPAEAETIRQLIIPAKPSFLQVEEEELAALARLSPKKRSVALRQHLQKWFFIGAGYDGPRFSTQRQLERRLRQIPPAPPAKKEKIAPVKLSKKIRVIIGLTRVVAEWKDERKKNNIIGCCVLDDFAREFARRYKIPYRLIRYAVPRDFTRIVRQDPKLKPELVQRAKDGVAWALSGQKHSDFFIGEQCQTIDKFLNSVKQQSDTVSGVVAYPGLARGLVRIVRHPNQDLFKRGEILLTSMTRPEFIPLMKKAKAVLCDEGGLLSHAAIVARELKIPCLVGLKNAMASFKSGDKIEVDANQGLVRKL